MEIFGNPISPATTCRALRQRERFAQRFGYDPNAKYPLRTRSCGIFPGLELLNTTGDGAAPKAENGVVIGTIRMGYGHYRIGLAMASAARSMGIRPYWLDLLSFADSPGARIIRHLDGLYSFGSRLSRKSKLFDALYWEPLTAKTFRQLSYNAMDREMCRLMAPVLADLDPEMPLIGCHSWPAQAAIHAGMKRVVNAVPDNFPLALHLAEGAHHTVQSPSAYLGYRMLQDMGRPGEFLQPIPAEDITLAGHYVDHEIVANLESDTAARMERIEKGQPRRILVSVGGTGVQGELAIEVVRHFASELREGSLALYLNAGDHRDIAGLLQVELDEQGIVTALHDDWAETASFAEKAAGGVHLFLHTDPFAAVYATNLLMRRCDVLITKPSELAFYPVPKLFLPRVGGHEAWGAIRSSEIGDGTAECGSAREVLRALEVMISERDVLRMYNEAILRNARAGVYNGAYRAVELAMERKALPRAVAVG